MKLLYLNFKTKEVPFVSLLILILFFIIWPLFKNGLPPTHDGEYHVVRAYQFDKTLWDGDFYPRWLPDLNYGYGIPLLNYYYPLPYYAISLIHIFNDSFIESFKISMVIAFLLSAVFFFLWARIFWGRVGGFVAALLYSFSPYHIVELYVRGAVGEVWSLTFFPAFLWSITKAILEQKQVFFPASALFFALIIFSHNILAFMFFPFAIFYVLFLVLLSKEKLHAIRYVLYTFILGLGLSIIFWLPAIGEIEYVEGLQIYSIKENFPELYQLLIPSWGTGFSGGGLNGQMSFQIGLVNLGAVFFSFIAVILFYRRRDKKLIITGFLLSWFMLILFLMNRVSLFIWETVPLMNYFQFPWRLLVIEILIASFLGGSIAYIFNGKKRFVIIILTCIASVGLSIGYVSPAYYLERNDNYYFSRPNFIDGTNTPGNFFNTVWFNKNINKRKQKKFEIISGKGLITDEKIKSTRYKFSIFAENDVVVRVNTAYFPGWKVAVNGVWKNVGRDKDGLIVINIPKGKHSVQIMLTNTVLQNISIIISFISLLIILFSIFRHGIIKK